MDSMQQEERLSVATLPVEANDDQSAPDAVVLADDALPQVLDDMWGCAANDY